MLIRIVPVQREVGHCCGWKVEDGLKVDKEKCRVRWTDSYDTKRGMRQAIIDSIGSGGVGCNDGGIGLVLGCVQMVF